MPSPSFLGKVCDLGGNVEINVPAGAWMVAVINTFSFGTYMPDQFSNQWVTFSGTAWISDISDDGGNEWGYASRGIDGDTTPYYNDGQPFEQFARLPSAYVTTPLLIGDQINVTTTFSFTTPTGIWQSNDPPAVEGVGEIFAFQAIDSDVDFFPADGPRGIPIGLFTGPPGESYGEPDDPPPVPGDRISLPVVYGSGAGGLVVARFADSGYYDNDGNWYAAPLLSNNGCSPDRVYYTAGWPADQRDCDGYAVEFAGFEDSPQFTIHLGAVSRPASDIPCSPAWRNKNMPLPHFVQDDPQAGVGLGTSSWCAFSPWTLVGEESDGDTDTFCAYHIKTGTAPQDPYQIGALWDVGAIDVGLTFAPGNAYFPGGKCLTFLDFGDALQQCTSQSHSLNGGAFIEVYLGAQSEVTNPPSIFASPSAEAGAATVGTWAGEYGISTTHQRSWAAGRVP